MQYAAIGTSPKCERNFQQTVVMAASYWISIWKRPTNTEDEEEEQAEVE